MKIGVLTFHRCINYGSYWQARCLVEHLRARGFDAQLLDFRSPRAHFSELKCALQPTLPTPTAPGDRVLYHRKIEKFEAAFGELPLSPRFDLDAPAAMEHYDAIVVGSDEVWNLSHPWFGHKPLFYGEGAHAEKLVAYAASFGNWRGELPDSWANRLRRFDAIAVRDDNSRAIVQRAVGAAPGSVLDPCLAFSEHIVACGEVPRGEYLAVYGHNFSARFAGHVRAVAALRGVPLVSIGYRNSWADEQWLEVGPHQFAAVVGNAAGVATNFFHGCVFSLLNAKPLACEVTDYRSVKVTDLLSQLGAQAHLTNAQTTNATFDELLKQPLDLAVTERVEELRAQSVSWLKSALGASC